MHQQFQQHNPFREPAWRCRRTLSLLDGDSQSAPSRLHDDKWVKRYHSFLRRWNRNEEEHYRLSLFPDNPGLFYAHLLYYNPDHEWRFITEASILAGETDEEIAKQISTIPSAIGWYEKLFFDVRNRLTSKRYIIKMILGSMQDRLANASGSITEHQRGMCYKFFAYFGGGVMLDILLSGFGGRTPPSNAEEAKQWTTDVVSGLIQRKALMGARCFEINKFNVMQLLDIQIRLMEHERQAKAHEGPKSDYSKNIEEMLLSLPVSVGKRGIDMLNESQQRYATTALEPRADEALLLANNQIPATLEQEDVSAIAARAEHGNATDQVVIVE